ncbi:MAG TPA: hypothetical protein VFZ12_05420 [Dehalococcoidia bacterium]|nr:hypothetical protein [Dehalococcoidia bacterium]
MESRSNRRNKYLAALGVVAATAGILVAVLAISCDDSGSAEVAEARTSQDADREPDEDPTSVPAEPVDPDQPGNSSSNPDQLPVDDGGNDPSEPEEPEEPEDPVGPPPPGPDGLSNGCDQDPTDSDGDGLIDVMEDAFGGDPNDPDTDNDGLLDGQEVMHSPCALDVVIFSHADDADSDNDGCNDGTEFDQGTGPMNPDDQACLPNGGIDDIVIPTPEPEPPDWGPTDELGG